MGAYGLSGVGGFGVMKKRAWESVRVSKRFLWVSATNVAIFRELVKKKFWRQRSAVSEQKTAPGGGGDACHSRGLC
jgi:hypothetical protein